MSDEFNPYRSTEAEVVRTRTDEGDLMVATRVSRLLAKLLDGFLSWFFTLPSLLLALVSPELRIVSTILCWIVYFGLQLNQMKKTRQTLGKKFLGIRVVRTDGSRVDLPRWVVLRGGITMAPFFIGFAFFALPTVLGIFSLLGFFLVLVDIFMIFGESQRCLHDRFADTIVVMGADDTSVPEG